jgi:endoglycosylceramidase
MKALAAGVLMALAAGWCGRGVAALEAVEWTLRGGGSAALASAPEPAEALRVRSRDGTFVDGLGRVRIFHGTNLVVKQAPFLPVLSGPECSREFQNALCASDLDDLEEWGFTVVRLGVSWQAVEPREGQVNTTYLAGLRDVVLRLRERGIFALIDHHQDLLGEQMCGEGFPGWVVARLHKLANFSNTGPRRFPSPLPFRVEHDNATGLPNMTQCQRHGDFGAMYFSFASQAAWRSLYDSPAVWELFARCWGAIARALKGVPVLGYELLNEPPFVYTAGPLEVWRHYLSDRRALLPMYERLHAAIRAEDDEGLLFYEGMTSGEYAGLADSDLVTDLTAERSPGGTAYAERQAFSYHVYCPNDAEGTPSPWLQCEMLLGRSWSIYSAAARKQRPSASLLTEFGAVGFDQHSIALLHHVTEAMDRELQGWIYWSWKSFYDITTQNPRTETFYYANGTLARHKAAALARPYAIATAGLPTRMANAKDGRMFELEFLANLDASRGAAALTTEIYLGLRDVATIVVSPLPAVEYELQGRHRLVVRHRPDQLGNATAISVTVTYV